MTTTNPVPSSDVSDLLFNAQKLDEIVNSALPEYTDRLGVVRQTATGATASIRAFNSRGAWVTATLYQIRDLVVVSDVWYACVAVHTSGATFVGDAANWRVHQGATKEELADPSLGDVLIATRASGTGALSRTQHDVNAAFVDSSQYDTLHNAVAAAALGGYVLRLKDGAIYNLTTTLVLDGIRGLFGSAEIRWAGTDGANVPLLDTSNNSGLAIGGGSMGELILRCDTPSRCRMGIKMGGGSISTFQNTVERTAIIMAGGGGDPANPGIAPGIFGGGLPSLAVEGGPTASNALNDGVFTDVRVDGCDVAYQVSAPDIKWYAGTIRAETSGFYGIGIKATQNTKISAFGTVFSESCYPLQLGHGIWGATMYGCWFEGVTKGMILIDTPLTEISGDVSFYSCHYDTDTPASYLFDLDNWRPGSLTPAGYFKIAGGNLIAGNFTTAIRLHNDGSRNPLTVHIDGINDALAPITWSGNTSRVSIRSAAYTTIGNTTGGISRHFTKYESAVTWSSIAAHDRDLRTITVTGVRVADNASVIATPSGLLANGLIAQSRVSADNTVQLLISNTTTSAATPGTFDWRIEVFTH